MSATEQDEREEQDAEETRPSEPPPRSLADRLTPPFLRPEGARVPVLRQDSELECGAAALAMVLRFYGLDVPVPEVHERCNVGRDGATALDIVKAAQSYGLAVKTYTKLELDELREAPTPAILHWKFSHFVVLERWNGRKARIVDPGIGRRTVDRHELHDDFTGVALTFSPGVQFDRARGAQGDGEEPAWRLLVRRALRAPGVRRLMVQIVVASLLLQLLGLAVPGLMKLLVDRVLPLGIDDIMPVLGLGILAVLLSQLVAAFLRGLLLVTLQARLDAQLTAGFFEHVLTLPFGYFQERPSGDLLQRLSSNTQIRDVLTAQTVSGLLDGVMVIAYSIILIVIEPLFGLLVLGLGVVQVILLILTTRRMTGLVTDELAAEAESQSFLVESLGNIGTLKSTGTESRVLNRWTGVFAGQLDASMRRGRLGAGIAAFTQTIQRFSPLILLWVGAKMVLDGSISLGTMLAVTSLGQQFLTPLANLVTSGQQLQQVGGHLYRVGVVLQAEPEQDVGRVRIAPPLSGAIELDDVCFRYDDSAPWVVRDFSLSIEPGQKVAFVGRTGSGKSTLAKLVLGLYRPTSGTIRFDGHDLHELDLRTVRAQFGVVMQDAGVRNGSVRENIADHDDELPFEEVVRAARIAELDEDVEALPMKYDTIVGEGGGSMSGGQRQRLALARALAHDPVMLLLDEATSSLDMETEAKIGARLIEQGRTTIVIAHRLSTIRDADVICVFDKGEEVERGTHEELIAAGGLYADLVRDQLKARART